MSEAVNPSYEDIQQKATGPGVAEWRQIDKARADLSAAYESLKDDTRYTEEHRAETAWAKYEETRSQVEKLAPEGRKKMLRSAEGLERMSVPTPEHESLITKDTDKLLLTAHERSRIEGLINRAQKLVEKGPFHKANPADLLAREYARGLDEGGPGGGATVRAVYELVRDWGLDINGIVDEHRKAHHHGALEDAQAARIRADMVGRGVPEPPFKRGGASHGSGGVGTYRGNRDKQKALIPNNLTALAKKFAEGKRRRPWR